MLLVPGQSVTRALAMSVFAVGYALCKRPCQTMHALCWTTMFALLTDPTRAVYYRGEAVRDPYGRAIPRHAHGTVNLKRSCASSRRITEGIMELYGRIVDPKLLIRRINLTAARVRSAEYRNEPGIQLSLFEDPCRQAEEAEAARLERELRQQKAILQIRQKFGKNAILRGMSLEEGATAIERNGQIGGHKA